MFLSPDRTGKDHMDLILLYYLHTPFPLPGKGWWGSLAIAHITHTKLEPFFTTLRCVSFPGNSTINLYLYRGGYFLFIVSYQDK